MLKTGLSSCPTLLSEDGLDLDAEEKQTSPGADFGALPVLEQWLRGDVEKKM